MMNALATYLLAAMVAWSPLSAHLYTHEGAPVTAARYDQIAGEVADAVAEEDPLFPGADGRARTALYLLAVASYESGGFRADVQFCRLGGDGGHAWGLFQSHEDRALVCSGIRGAVHVALRQMRESLAACHALPPEERLSVYAAGNCTAGVRESRRRVRRAVAWWAAHPYTPPSGTTASP